MRVVAGILGLAFIVLPIVAIAMGELESGFLFAAVIGPAFLLYAWAGQKGLEKYFPQLAEANRNNKKKPDDSTS